MRDLLILSDERRSDDLAGLTEVGSILRATAGIKTQIEAVPATNTAEMNRLLVRQIDPSGRVQGFLWGGVVLPLMHMSSPDGHNEEIYLASEEPFEATADNAYAAGGSAATSGAPFYLDTTQEVRPFGVVNLEGVEGFYSDYLVRLNDYLAGRTTFTVPAISDDHLVYRTDISPHGAAMVAQFEAAYGPGSCLTFNSADHDDDPWTQAAGGATPYYSEMGSLRPIGYGLFSGGRDKTAEYYLATAASALQIKPAALWFAIFGSALMDMSGYSLLPALLAGGLSSFWTGYVFPDLSKWLAGQETLGEALVRHANLYGRQGEINLVGFPGLMVPPRVQPKPRTPVQIPVVTPTPTPVPVTTGASKLSSDEFNALDVRLKAVEAFMKAQQTGQTTSEGQTGAPTGTVPATGNSGAPPTGTGAAVVPALVINCGAADSLSAKSGLVWLNLPEASVAIDLTSVAVPLPIGVYHSGRGGPRAEWAFPGYTAGALAVRLDFNEPHWVQPGNRLQDVTINGVKVLSGFDIVAAAGAMNKAVSKSFAVLVGADGVLSIVLTATPGSPDMNTYLCGIGIG